MRAIGLLFKDKVSCNSQTLSGIRLKYGTKNKCYHCLSLLFHLPISFTYVYISEIFSVIGRSACFLPHEPLVTGRRWMNDGIMTRAKPSRTEQSGRPAADLSVLCELIKLSSQDKNGSLAFPDARVKQARLNYFDCATHVSAYTFSAQTWSGGCKKRCSLSDLYEFCRVIR